MRGKSHEDGFIGVQKRRRQFILIENDSNTERAARTGGDVLAVHQLEQCDAELVSAGTGEVIGLARRVEVHVLYLHLLIHRRHGILNLYYCYFTGLKFVEWNRNREPNILREWFPKYPIVFYFLLRLHKFHKEGLILTASIGVIKVTTKND